MRMYRKSRLAHPQLLLFMACQHASRPAVIAARGHFLSIPERSPQKVTDMFAVGSLAALVAYAARPLPYEPTCCEYFVEKSLTFQCFSRDQRVLEEEFVSPDEVARYNP